VTKAGPGNLTLTSGNLYAGSTVITGGTLKLHYVAPPTSGPPVTGYAYWFDASQLTGYNDGDNVNSWRNLGSAGGTAVVPTTTSGSGPNYAGGNNIAPTYNANAGTGTGLPALSFTSAPTSAATSEALQFPQDSNIRTVFSIFQGASFLLTDIAAG